MRIGDNQKLVHSSGLKLNVLYNNQEPNLLVYFTTLPQYLLLLWRATVSFLSNHNKTHSYSKNQFGSQHIDWSEMVSSYIKAISIISHPAIYSSINLIMSIYSAPAVCQSLDKRQQTFARKDQIINTLGSLDHMIFVIATQLLLWYKNQQKNISKMSGCSCVAIKF